MKTLVLKSYPDGTVSVTRKVHRLRVSGPKSCKWDALDAARREAVNVLGASEVAHLLGIELGVGGESPFPCQELKKSNKDSKPVRTGLTDRGRKTLRRAFAAWETQLQPGICAFGTLTLSPAAVDSLMTSKRHPPAVAYQQALSLFMDRLRRLLVSRGLPGDVIWVTEIHPSRSQRVGIAIPHVHFVCQTAHIKYQWLIKPSEIKHLWESAINAHGNASEGKRFPSRCEIKCVKKSVARYVAKYLSKTKKDAILNRPSMDTSMLPERWYAIANALHKLTKKMTSVISGEEVCDIMNWLQSKTCPIVKRWGNITLPSDDGRPVWLASWFILHCPVDSDGLRLMAFS